MSIDLITELLLSWIQFSSYSTQLQLLSLFCRRLTAQKHERAPVSVSWRHYINIRCLTQNKPPTKSSFLSISSERASFVLVILITHWMVALLVNWTLSFFFFPHLLLLFFPMAWCRRRHSSFFTFFVCGDRDEAQSIFSPAFILHFYCPELSWQIAVSWLGHNGHCGHVEESKLVLIACQGQAVYPRWRRFSPAHIHIPQSSPFNHPAPNTVELCPSDFVTHTQLGTVKVARTATTYANCM